MSRPIHRIHYQNLLLTALGICLAVYLGLNPQFHQLLTHAGTLGYFGAFLAGMFFVSTFTVATSAVILFEFAEVLPAWQIGLIAGLGAVVGDFIIFRFVKDDLLNDVDYISHLLDPQQHLKHLLHTPYFSWLLPVIGAAVIASPLPDELGISLLGLSTISAKKFLIISYLLNSVGIFVIVSTAAIVKQL